MVHLTRPEGSRPEDFHLSRRGIAGLIFAGYAAAAFSAEADPIHTDEAGLTTGMVQVPAADRPIPAYVAQPSTAKGPFPAVLVMCEVFGLHEYIRDVCRRLAKIGYVAIAPDFFVRAGDPSTMTDMGAIMKIVQATPDAQVLSDVGATIAYLKSRPDVIGVRMAITGFCWGGAIVWLACETFPDFRAGVSWYGRLAPDPGAAPQAGKSFPIDKAAQLKAPVLGLYGGQDPLAQAVPAMRQALDAAHETGTEIIVYPDAGHGFHADYRTSYNDADARDGWMRMLAHFAANGAVSRHDPPNHSHHAAVRRSGRRSSPNRSRHRRGHRG
jgi:carboxymethylenebutenolidase